MNSRKELKVQNLKNGQDNKFSKNDFKRRIQSGELDFVLVLPESLQHAPLDVGQSKIKLYLNDAKRSLPDRCVK